MNRSKRRALAVALVAFMLLGMLAWDELGSRDETASVYARLLVYGFVLACGGLLGSNALLRSDRSSFKPFTEHTLPSAYLPLVGVMLIVDAVLKVFGVFWMMDGLEAFARYFLLYSVGIACECVLSYRRAAMDSSGT